MQRTTNGAPLRPLHKRYALLEQCHKLGIYGVRGGIDAYGQSIKPTTLAKLRKLIKADGREPVA